MKTDVHTWRIEGQHAEGEVSESGSTNAQDTRLQTNFKSYPPKKEPEPHQVGAWLHPETFTAQAKQFGVH